MCAKARCELQSLSAPETDSARRLEELQKSIEGCGLCPLAETRNSIVFGSGSPSARVMIIGEAPGRNEDLHGVPFVGAAGKKLDDFLLAAGLDRADFYIANVVKCRPPSNRNPHVGEINSCSPYLRQQIRAIWPDALICLGNFATQFVMHTDKGVSELRGSLYTIGHFQVLPTFHPAACIYHPDYRDLLIDDLRLLKTWLDEHPRGSIC